MYNWETLKDLKLKLEEWNLKYNPDYKPDDDNLQIKLFGG